ncbi:MAG: hypothetical protein JW809_03370 [Pirellulales bacterium]|nr:hypothetical protein [Pirellulales bacterium]
MAPEPNRAQDAQIAAHAEAERAGMTRLRSLSMRERGQLMELACEAAAALRQSRLAAGLPDVKPDPWPQSTWDFLKEHAARFRT